MRHRFLVIPVLLSLVLLLLPAAATAQLGISAANNQATLQFPETIIFSVDLQSDAPINRVVLEYGAQQLTCGTVVAKAFPEFTPSKNVTVKWTWEMKQSGSQPPGAAIWWRWRVTNTDGKELLTEQQTATWLDSEHSWQTLGGGQVNVHWYSGSKSFAAQLRDAAEQSLAKLSEITGLKSDGPIDLYIYASVADLRQAILYQPSWIGGAAFPEHNSVIIAVPIDELGAGKRTVTHEVTHILVGRFTFSCLGDFPSWLVEGLAMYGEGGPDPDSLRQFKAAVTDDKLLSVRALSGGFAEAADKAGLSYSQSYSLVNFLITEYGRDKVLALLRALRDGTALDDAMRATYGFDVDGLEDAWRAKIGAKPRPAVGPLAATPTPTLVPTLVPVAGVLTPTPSPTPAPPTATSAPTATPAPSRLSAPPLLIGGAVLLGTAVVIAAILLMIAIARRQKGMKP